MSDNCEYVFFLLIAFSTDSLWEPDHDNTEGKTYLRLTIEDRGILE